MTLIVFHIKNLLINPLSPESVWLWFKQIFPVLLFITLIPAGLTFYSIWCVFWIYFFSCCDHLMSPWGLLVSCVLTHPLTLFITQCIGISLLLEFVHDIVHFLLLTVFDVFLPLVCMTLPLTLRHSNYMCLTHFNTIRRVYIADIIFLLYAFGTCTKAVLQQSALKLTVDSVLYTEPCAQLISQIAKLLATECLMFIASAR